jgi:uncharacterized protein (TIGR02145 family)
MPYFTSTNNSKYGKLYNWYAVTDPRGLAPKGWHIPTDLEWTILTDYLGGAIVAGGKLKEVGTTNWNSPNTNATNTSLFTGLPGGSRNYDGNYFGIGEYGYLWSSTENFSNHAWGRRLDYLGGSAVRDDYDKLFGFSVRCLRD